MEDLQMNKIEITSKIHNYEVIFDDYQSFLLNEINDGDAIIIDAVVFGHYREFFSQFKNQIVFLSAIEKQKSYYEVGNIINILLEKNFKRNKKIICIGGGTIQDACSFVSLIFNRGVKWLFVPTTLLAQADSCIGGKISINFEDKKNQIGSFYPPQKILIDTSFINTLSEKDYFSGIGEMLHYFLLSPDKKLEIFRKYWDKKEFLETLIQESLLIKKRFIEVDEFDENQRKILNYGHSFGHALESITNYKVPHGIAVCYGMAIANFTSFKLGFLDYKDCVYMNKVIFRVVKKSGITVDFSKIDKKQFLTFLQKDKKSTSCSIGIILTRGIGDMYLQQIEYGEIFPIINEFFNMFFETQQIK